MPSNRLKLIALTLSAVGLISACGGGGPNGSPPASSTPPASTGTPAQQTLDAVLFHLQTDHIGAFGNVAKADFLATAAALRTRLPGLSDDMAVAEMMRLVATIADGHTSLSRWNGTQRFPWRGEWFSDGLFIHLTTAEFSGLMGAKVLSVNGIAAQEVQSRLAGYWPAETLSASLFWGPNLLQNELITRHAGLSDSASMQLVIERANGTTERISSKAEPNPTLSFSTPAALPLDRMFSELPFGWTRLPDAAAAPVFAVRYRQCRDAPGFAAMASALFSAVDGLPAGSTPPKIVVDLRGNGGGDSAVMAALTIGLRERRITNTTRLGVLTDRGSFSAAVDGLLDLLQLGALHAGEAPGQRPNFLGNVVTVNVLPLNVALNYPTRVSIRVAGSPAMVMPALPAQRTSADYFAGRDPALAAIYGRWRSV